MAYSNHDLDDALRSGIISIGDVPKEFLNVLGDSGSKRINKMVSDIIFETKKADMEKIVVGKEVEEAMLGLRSFLFNTVYMNDKIKGTFLKAQKVVKELKAQSSLQLTGATTMKM